MAQDSTRRRNAWEGRKQARRWREWWESMENVAPKHPLFQITESAPIHTIHPAKYHFYNEPCCEI